MDNKLLLECALIDLAVSAVNGRSASLNDVLKEVLDEASAPRDQVATSPR